MLLYAITDRYLVGDQPAAQRDGLIALARVWAENGVALAQLREKDLPVEELIALAQAMQRAVRDVGATTRILLNASPAVARAAGADGVHLPASAAAQRFDEIRKFNEIRSQSISDAASSTLRSLWISVACHTQREVEQARDQNVDCILFAPVFEKRISSRFRGEYSEDMDTLPGVGLAALAAACSAAHPVPVLALGGVTAHNAASCVAAGASGIAAIRLFHGSPRDWSALR
jgi:thiamine-phosphate pyrophosphorylase